MASDDILSIGLYRRAFIVWQYRKTSLLLSTHWCSTGSSNGLVLSGNKPSPDPCWALFVLPHSITSPQRVMIIKDNSTNKHWCSQLLENTISHVYVPSFHSQENKIEHLKYQFPVGIIYLQGVLCTISVGHLIHCPLYEEHWYWQMLEYANSTHIADGRITISLQLQYMYML